MTEGLVVTALGMIVVFCVLLIIAAFIAFSSKFFVNGDKEKTVEPVVQKVVLKPEPEVRTEQPVVACAPAQDLELIAVITAAIAMETGKNADDLVVRSIRRVKAWNRFS